MKAAISRSFNYSIKTTVCLLAIVLLLAVAPAFAAGSSSLVITQVYPTGAQAGAAYLNNYVELFNAGSTSVDLRNWSLAIGNATTDSYGAAGNIFIGSNDAYGAFGAHDMTVAGGCVSSSTSICYNNGFNGILQPGQYLLVLVRTKSPTGNPAPVAMPLTADLDISIPAATALDHSSLPTFSTSKGKVGIVNENPTALGGSNFTGMVCTGSNPHTANPDPVVDYVGYGAPNCYEGAASPLNTTPADGSKGALWAIHRKNDCVDTNSNVNDFAQIQIGGITGFPVDPTWKLHNSTSIFNGTDATTTTYLPVDHNCTSSRPPLVVLTTTGPFNVGGPGVITVTATVTPGANPASISETVTGDMSQIGGSTNETFTTTDNITFTYAAGTVNTNNPATYTVGPVTATDDQNRTSLPATTSVIVHVPAPPTVALAVDKDYCPVAAGGTCTVVLTATATKGNWPAASFSGVSGGDMTACTGSTPPGANPQAYTHISGGTSTTSLYSYTCTMPTDTAKAPLTFMVTATDTAVPARIATSNTVTVTIDTHTNPSAVLSVSPATFDQGGPTAVTVTATVTPGTNPPSSGITVTSAGDMTPFGGAASGQVFTDSGDHINFKFNGTVNTSSTGTQTVPAVTVTDKESGTGTSGTTTLTVNLSPVADPQSVTVAYETAKPITLVATGTGTLTYAVVTPPTNGTLSGTAPNLSYTPNNSYYGPDSFTFKVNDGIMDSPVATVNLTVNPAVPVATSQSVNVNYMTATAVTLSATGVGPLTFAVAAQPAHGAVICAGADCTYTPADTYSGPDSFSFTATNQGGPSTPATVSITVGTAPSTPIAQPQAVTTAFETALSITLKAAGGNGNPLTYAVVAQPINGTLAGTAPNLIYTPHVGYFGPDSFTFKANDGTSDSNTATVSITVNLAVPVAHPQAVTAGYEIAEPITLTATSAVPVTWSVTTQPAHGTLSGTAPALTYTPNAAFVGADSFTFTATNAGGTSTAATVSITVSAPAVPVAQPQAVTASYQTATPITITATGAGPLTYAVATQPAHGTLSGTAPTLTYTPNAAYVGADSFTFTTANPGGTSAPATVSLTVLAPAAPTAQLQSVTVSYETGKSITLAATGAGPITYSVTTQPAHGTLSGTAPALTYTPATGYIGPDSFAFTATNPGGTSAPATVSITVSVPAAPTAQTQSVTVSYQTATPITLTATGTGPMTWATSQPLHGTLTGTAPALTYTPSAGYVGSDSFTFTATNIGGTSASAPVSINVVSGTLTVAPASGGSGVATVNAGETATFNLMVSGWTGATAPVTFTCNGAPTPCTVTPNPATLNGTTGVPVAVSVATTGKPVTAGGFVSAPGPTGGLLALALAGLAAIFVMSRNRKLQWRFAGACAALLIAVGGLSSCGVNQSKVWSTPSGAYNLTVTATSGNVSKAYVLTLNIK